MTTIIIVTLFTAAVIGFGLIMKHLRTRGFKAPKPVPPKPAPKPAETPEEAFKKVLDSLLKTNLMIRKDPLLSTELVSAIEEVIDDLKAATPAMLEKYPGETLTYEIKNIGLKHLHRIVKEYLDLSPEGRQEQLSTFQSTIESLHEVIHRSRQIAENNETAEFKTMAHFLAGKFA